MSQLCRLWPQNLARKRTTPAFRFPSNSKEPWDTACCFPSAPTQARLCSLVPTGPAHARSGTLMGREAQHDWTPEASVMRDCTTTVPQMKGPREEGRGTGAEPRLLREQPVRAHSLLVTAAWCMRCGAATAIPSTNRKPRQTGRPVQERAAEGEQDKLDWLSTYGHAEATTRKPDWKTI